MAGEGKSPKKELSERRNLEQKPVGFLAKVGQAWFATCLVGALISTWCFVTLSTSRLAFWDKNATCKRWATRASIFWFHCSLWVAVKLQPQITVKCEGFEQFDKVLSQRPLCLMANHLSFMDMIITCAFVPARIICDAKTLFKSTLYNIPIFGAIAAACRHIPVFFKADVSGKFSTDDAKKAITQQRVEETLTDGYHLTMFPEGTMNRADVTQLQPFRWGSFKALLAHNADLWGLAIHNTEKCWPINAKDGNNTGNMGGFSSELTLRLFPIAEHGCSEFVGGEAKVVKDANSDAFSEQVKIVADKAKEIFQVQIDDLHKKDK